LIGAAAIPVSAVAQLRPLDQANWSLIRGGETISARIGAARLNEQKASLAGTSGSLWEAGIFSIAWRTGRVTLEAAGTAQRFFREDERFAESHAEVLPTDDGHRHDSGDYRIGTSVRLTPDRSPVVGALRFGTRLPTTDNTTGLDRDAVDFFATVGGAGSFRSILISGEAGLGIHSTREIRFEQEDVLLYSLRAELTGSRITPSVEVLGQRHGTTHDAIRGVENLGELRAGLRLGSTVHASFEGVFGYEDFSAPRGFIIAFGYRR
jgi:hypothetical protein